MTSIIGKENEVREDKSKRKEVPKTMSKSDAHLDYFNYDHFEKVIYDKMDHNHGL